MARPWLPIGYFVTAPSEAVPGTDEVVVGEASPGVSLVLIRSREYLVKYDGEHWVVSVR